ncbi:MAG: hypothetical protein ACUVYA_19795 [Planctomycetota bacterium]
MPRDRIFEAGPAEIDDAVPPPFVLNCWKHHARAIAARVQAAASAGEEAVRALPRRLLLVGEDLMDLYVGDLPPEAIALELRSRLEARGFLERAAFAAWLRSRDGYATEELSDGSRWVLREAPLPERYAHTHPARRSPLSRRVRANALKTACATLSWARLRGLDPFELATVNEARRELLGLSPTRSVRAGEGLGDLLRALAPLFARAGS